MIRFVLRGIVREAESGVGVAGLFVKAYDKDLLFDDLLGTAVTGPDGAFEVVTEATDFREFFEQRPDLYLRVFGPDRETEIWSTERAIRWQAGRYEEFDVRIPRDRLGASLPSREVELLGTQGKPQTVFDPGESLSLHVRGLRPVTAHSVRVADADGELFTATVITSRYGVLGPTVLWPMIGIEDPREVDRVTIEEARRRWHDREIQLTVSEGERVVAETKLRLDAGLARTLVVGSDQDGFVLNGFEVGEHGAHVTIHNPPDWETARVWLVARQHDWRPGDAIRPVTLASGRAAGADIVVAKQKSVTVAVAEADELEPGAYDFVVRRIRYGYEDNDDHTLRPDDLVGGRNITGLVVRERFMASKVIRGGCVNQQRQIAGRFIGIWPYMQFTDTFQLGEDIYCALDPAALDPAHTSKMVALYVVPHKTAAQWSSDSSLQHLAVLGGNPAVPRWLTQSWCINANLRLIWPQATAVGAYDVIADFGNNTADPTTFTPNDSFDPPLDLIDGYTIAGFRVVPDPTTDTSFAFTGSFQYDESTEGYIDVVDDIGVSWHVRLKATVRFPADVAGATNVSQISAVQASYPLVVLVHGNGADGGYLGYDYLLDHLARNGFIAASIHMEPNERGTDRARVLRRHLEILSNRFGAHLANNIGIMGHSRGGEAVVIAARLNQQEAWGYGINAVISLAPTNRYTFEQFAGAWAKPYLVIYGSLDGDVAGIPQTGFELYDNASGMKKSMAFVYRSCHDRYNTVWGDGDLTASWSSLTPTDVPRVLSVDAHHKIAMGYMAAFFREHLRGETQWEGIFRGEWTPAAVQAADANMKIYVQYEDPTVRTVDDFEGAHTGTSWSTSAIGGTVSQTGLPATPQENALRTLDSHSPHQTAGLLLTWNDVADALRFEMPAGQQDVSGYQAVSFRITQRADSGSNPANQLQDFRLTLTDAGGHSRAIRISKFAEIPYPDVRGNDYYTKSAMRTVRIPLGAYTIRCLNIDAVDLSNVVTLAFEFAEKPTGEIEIDTVQFTQ